jgi:hypothetical protein
MPFRSALGARRRKPAKPKPPTPTNESSATEKAHHVRWEKVNRLAMMIIRASIRESLRGGMAVSLLSTSAKR